VTHPLHSWLDAIAPGGRMILPLTVTMSPSIGKGLLVQITRGQDDQFDARMVMFVAIYSAIGVRDDALNAQLGVAMKGNPMPRLKRLRRDAHDAGPSCWFHGSGWCLSTTQPPTSSGRSATQASSARVRA